MTHAAPPAARQRLSAGDLPRHRHADAYLTLVLEGGYEEAGDCGRRKVGPGDVIVHEGFEGHLDRVDRRGAWVVNLPAEGLALAPYGRIADPDAVARALERDLPEALSLLRAGFMGLEPAALDWPDRLAWDLRRDPGLCLGAWARAHALSAEHVARGFRQVFGAPPRRFAAELRAHAAWRDLKLGDQPLAAVAADLGFADQPHMTRAVGALTGRAPGAWRRSTGFKTGAADGA
jgi:AraC-like DNA-binding protein